MRCKNNKVTENAAEEKLSMRRNKPLDVIPGMERSPQLIMSKVYIKTLVFSRRIMKKMKTDYEIGTAENWHFENSKLTCLHFSTSSYSATWGKSSVDILLQESERIASELHKNIKIFDLEHSDDGYVDFGLMEQVCTYCSAKESSDEKVITAKQTCF